MVHVPQYQRARFRMVREAESFGIHWINDGKGLSIDQSENEMVRIGEECVCLGCNRQEKLQEGPYNIQKQNPPHRKENDEVDKLLNIRCDWHDTG